MFGQAKRFVSSVDGTFVYRLEIYCNLLVLDGNIYDKAPINTIKHKYTVFLQISKEHVEELAAYDKVHIMYTLNDNEQPILSGTFH